MNPRQLVLAGLATLALGAPAVAQTVQPTPPPPPNPAASPAGPQASPGPRVTLGPAPATPSSPAPATGRQRGRRDNAPSPQPSPSDTPVPSPFTALDGVWELVLQPITGPTAGKPFYSHLFVTQKGDQLSGRWVRDDQNKKAYDLTGTFDGRLIALTLSDAGKSAYTINGYVETFQDLVGLLKSTATPNDLGTPLTAEHRKKEKIQ